MFMTYASLVAALLLYGVLLFIMLMPKTTQGYLTKSTHLRYGTRISSVALPPTIKRSNNNNRNQKITPPPPPMPSSDTDKGAFHLPLVPPSGPFEAFVDFDHPFAPSTSLGHHLVDGLRDRAIWMKTAASDLNDVHSLATHIDEESILHHVQTFAIPPPAVVKAPSLASTATPMPRAVPLPASDRITTAHAVGTKPPAKPKPLPRPLSLPGYIDLRHPLLRGDNYKKVDKTKQRHSFGSMSETSMEDEHGALLQRYSHLFPMMMFYAVMFMTVHGALNAVLIGLHGFGWLT